MKFFHNPTKRKRKATRRRATAKRGKGGRFVSSKRRRTVRRRRPATVARKRRRSTITRSTSTMAKRRRSVTRRATATRRRRPATARRRSYKRIRGAVYKRNPGVVNVLVRGVKDAAVAVAGKTVGRFIGQKLPAFIPGQAGQAVNAAIAAAAIGMLGSRFLGADMARVLVQGAMQAPIESALQPVLSSIGLASYPMRPRLAAYTAPALAGYANVPTPHLSSYPNAATMAAAY